jgi:hypothetical protein
MTSSRFGCSDGFSLAGRMTDRRAEPRQRLTRTVQVMREGRTAQANCRDMSDTGMKLDLTSPLDLNDMVTVALSPTIVLCASVAWLNGRECGLIFDAAVDSATLLRAAGLERQADTAETLTLLGNRPGASRTLEQRRETAEPEGAHFQPGLAVTVMLGTDRERRGVVRWARDNIAALELAPAGMELTVDERPARAPLRLPAPR